MCCWCAPSYWDVKTKKCYAGVSFLVGIVLVVFSIVVPFFLPNRLEVAATAQANDVLTIPAQSKTSGQFTYADWLDNSNEKWHPPSFREFYFYNVTNTDFVSVITGQEKLVVEKIGPIAFKKKWQRFPETVEYIDNNNQVCYEFGIEFEFDASRSKGGLTPDSVLQTLNVPYLGGLVQAVVLGDAMGVEGSLQTYLPLMCAWAAQVAPELAKPGANQWFDNCSTAAANNFLPPFDNPNQCHACLFMNITINDLLFGSESNALHLLFRETPFSVPSPFFNPDNSQTLFGTSAALFHNCGSQKECYKEKALKTSYGLGGASQAFSTRFPSDQFALNLVTPGLGVPPANISKHTSSIKQCQYTGLNDDCFTKSFTQEACLESKVRQFSQWMGNTSTTMWGYSHPIAGAFDQEPQFHPFIQDDETLSLWIPDVMRSFDITFDSEQHWRGLDLKRFKPVDSIFGINGAAHGGGYGQEDTKAGFIKADATTLVKYGVAVPLYLSQPGYAGADLTDPVLTGVDCFVMENGEKKTCEVTDGGIYVDIEPTFGKVVRGGAGAQVNFKLESKFFKFAFGNLNAPSPYTNFVNETDLMIPFLIFSDTALAQTGQTDLLENSLNLLSVLPSVTWDVFGILMVVGGILIVVGAFFFGKASFQRQPSPLEEDLQGDPSANNLKESLLDDVPDIGELRQSYSDLKQQLMDKVDRLSRGNAELAAKAGEEAVMIEKTENTDILMQQIRQLEAANKQLLQQVTDAEDGQDDAGWS